MPVYNCHKTAAAAISSILNQTCHDWELVIIDDGSQDRTISVISQFRDSRIRLIEGKHNLGLPTRLNQAAALSRGKYFARMDGDDISYPNRLKVQLDFLEHHPEVDLIGGSISIFRGEGELMGWRAAKLSHADICGPITSRMSLAHVTWFGRRDWFVANPYDPTRTLAQDRDLLTRSHRHTRFGAVPDLVVGVRENKLSLRKQFGGRYQLAGSLVRDSIDHSDWVPFAAAACECAKFGLDFLAIATGLRYRLLRHRARPLDPSLARDWTETWNRLRSYTSSTLTPSEITPARSDTMATING